MYNEYYKKTYLEEVKDDINESTLGQLIVYFKNCEKYEEEYAKDVSCFTISEIIGYYKTIETSSIAFLQSMNSQFIKYTNWCMKYDMLPGNQNNFKNITIDMLEQCINVHMLNAKYVTREELIKLINRYEFNEADNFLLLALFEGICGNEYEEIRGLYPNDFVGNTVKLNSGRSFEVSDKLIELADEASKMEYYVISNGRKRMLSPNDKRCYKFPENTVGDDHKERFFIIRHITNMRDNGGYMFIGSKTLKESGRIDYMKRKMKEENISAEECLSKYREYIQYRFGRILNIQQYCSIYKNMLND